jgi:creatinine amidohydrolase/Fe(II)-dependent formamide hydrolase-like protein
MMGCGIAPRIASRMLLSISDPITAIDAEAIPYGRSIEHIRVGWALLQSFTQALFRQALAAMGLGATASAMTHGSQALNNSNRAIWADGSIFRDNFSAYRVRFQ